MRTCSTKPFLVQQYSTPKTLKQAIENGLQDKHAMFFHIKDFLAQRFGVAYFKAQSEEELYRLKELFEAINNEDDVLNEMNEKLERRRE